MLFYRALGRNHLPGDPAVPDLDDCPTRPVNVIGSSRQALSRSQLVAVSACRARCRRLTRPHLPGRSNGGDLFRASRPKRSQTSCGRPVAGSCPGEGLCNHPPGQSVARTTATGRPAGGKGEGDDPSLLHPARPWGIIEHHDDTIKADLRFGLYRYAETEMERHVAGLVDEQYEDDLMCRLTRSRRVIGCVEALRLRDLAEFAAARPSKKFGERFSEWAADEVAVAMRWTRNMAFAQLHLAVTVTSRLPGTLAALSRGEVDLRGVQALAEITNPLDDATAKAVEDAVLPKAADKNVSE